MASRVKVASLVFGSHASTHADDDDAQIDSSNDQENLKEYKLRVRTAQLQKQTQRNSGIAAAAAGTAAASASTSRGSGDRVQLGDAPPCKSFTDLMRVCVCVGGKGFATFNVVG